jgi:ankyrin repeat protein
MAKVNPNLTDPLWQQFRDTIFTGDFVRASELLGKKPALLHMMNSIGETALHFLAVEDDRDGVAWLHARGADLDTKNSFGQPVIFEVASLGYKELFTWFKDNGANLRATDNDGNDIVMHLLEYDCNEMAEWVRQHGA